MSLAFALELAAEPVPVSVPPFIVRSLSFITLLRSYGGDWFDKMEPGGWKVTLDTDEGHKAFDMLMKMNQFLEPTSLNASDDEANAGMLNGAWQYAPAEWGGSSMNDWWWKWPDQRFWLEAADRTDIGADLHAPNADESP